MDTVIHWYQPLIAPRVDHNIMCAIAALQWEGG